MDDMAKFEDDMAKLEADMAKLEAAEKLLIAVLIAFFAGSLLGKLVGLIWL